MKSPSVQTGRSKRCHAFTLIELLVIIAIVAVLVALTVGVANRVGEKGANIGCIHKLRQNARLIHATLADHRGELAYYDRRLSGYNGLWWHKMYLSSGLSPEAFSETMYCPLDRTYRNVPLGANKGTIKLGYRYNRRSGYHDGSANPAVYPIVNLSQHPSPARVPIMADSSNAPSDNALAFDEWVHVYASHGGAQYGRSLGHYGHVLFLDGHVERIDKVPAGAVVPGDYDLKIRER